MPKQYWINLPVKDLARSKKFFSRIGFSLHTKYESPESTGVSVEDGGLVVMLFERSDFERVARIPASDAGRSSEVMISYWGQSGNPDFEREICRGGNGASPSPGGRGLG